MAADSDGEVIETVVTCEGNLDDPDFSEKFDNLISQLGELLCSSKLFVIDFKMQKSTVFLFTAEDSSLKVNKVEPWNSVRVTLSIPRDAADRLRLLAQQGHQALRSLGILSVQIEGDQVLNTYQLILFLH